MRLASFCVLVLLISCTTVYAVEIIDADDPNIQYTGRVYFGDVKTPVFYWPGSFLIANFQGTSINIKYNDTGSNYMAVIIDDGPYTVLDCNAGDNTYVAATGLTDTVHKIQLFKRTETQQGVFRFKGFELDDGKGLLQTSKANRVLR
jgi:carbohydrate esterase-like protein